MTGEPCPRCHSQHGPVIADEHGHTLYCFSCQTPAEHEAIMKTRNKAQHPDTVRKLLENDHELEREAKLRDVD